MAWKDVRELIRRAGDKNTSSTYDRSTDSLEALSDKIGIPATSLVADATANRYTTGTIVEDSAMGTGTPNVVTVATSGTANTFGNWVQLDASLAANSYICGISLDIDVWNGPDNENFVIELGTGAGGAEVALARISFGMKSEYIAANNSGNSMPRYIPVNPSRYVASGTRLAAHTSNSSANARNVKIGIQYWNNL